MGASESTVEPETVVRFVDDEDENVNENRCNHEVTEDDIEQCSTGFAWDNPGHDWVSHTPKLDTCYGIPTVAPASTMLHERTFEDYEVVGGVLQGIRSSQQQDGFIESLSNYRLDDDDTATVTPSECLRYHRVPSRGKKMKTQKNSDDEGGFMAPHERSSSHLASLFGHDRASFTGGNESLTYTAPKDPKKEKSAAQGETPALLFATAVQAYRYVNNQHVNQGKLGVAVLGNHASHDYKILLYASKQQQVALAKIHSNFSFTVLAILKSHHVSALLIKVILALSSLKMINLGDEFPNFEATTSTGNISFHDWLGGSWAILFSHPADYTPVCTTELGHVTKLVAAFEKRGVKLIALSCDNLESHLGWIEDIKEYVGVTGEFPYPIIADPERELAIKLGMLDPDEKDKQGLPLTCRAVFIIGPDRKLKLSLLYPATTGRNFDEILRVVDSLQLTANKKVATPVDWKSGQRCMVLPNISQADAEKMFPKGVETQKMHSGKGYMRFTPHPE